MNKLKIKIFGGEPLDFPEDVQKMVDEWMDKNQDIEIISTKIDFQNFSECHNVIAFTLVYRS